MRYADAMVMVFGQEYDAKWSKKALPKRLGKYGLTLHPDKTKLVGFQKPKADNAEGSKSFDFLGFTHQRGKSRRCYWVVRQHTAKDRFSRATSDSSMVSCQQARAIDDATTCSRTEARRALWLPRQNVEIPGAARFLAGDAGSLAQVAFTPLA